MGTPGFSGKILLVNLTTRAMGSMESAKYEAFGGGHGTATAIFWDLCVAPGNWDLQDAFDPRNIVAFMTGPLAGTGLAFAGRTSVSGLAPQTWPVNWFGHSNFGGNFAPTLKMAGWDGVVVQGKADSPVYINIIDDRVTIEDAKWLWGLTVWDTQEEIWKQAPVRYGSQWQKLSNSYTLQRPAIVTIGPAGENKSRIASLVHGGGSSAGQGGFGGVFGSKNLKAIAIIGTGSIKVADPKAVRDSREWFEANFPMSGQRGPGRSFTNGVSGCMGCNRGCHSRSRLYGQDSDGCAESVWYSLPPPHKRTSPSDRWKAADLVQQFGLNASELSFMGSTSFPGLPGTEMGSVCPSKTGAGWYVKRLYDMGVIGPGKAVDTSPLPMEHIEKVEFAEIFALAIANRIGIGDLIAEGTVRFAEKIGRISDLNSILRMPAWGYVDHWTMPAVEWAYGNLMDSRDINNHDMQLGPTERMSCEQFVKLLASTSPPHQDDPFMFDYSWRGEQAYKTGIYSEHKAKFVAWHQHYATYYKESALFCDWAMGNYFNPSNPDGRGATPIAEPRFLNAVTGRNQTFLDGMEIGRRAWNLKRAIFVMQNRHRDHEKFAGYMYRPGASVANYATTLPVYNGSKWDWVNCRELYLDDKGVEQWKTEFYRVEGWDPQTGYPTRKTLEGLGLKYIADALQAKNKLGSS
jgi:aldehyde:ferredoxin oxidoreductase